eukprot:367790_1
MSYRQPKMENVNNDGSIQLTDTEAQQLLKELLKEEVTLKQLIFEFTQELEKTKLEEQMLKNLIEKQSEDSNSRNTNQNRNDKQEQEDDEDPQDHIAGSSRGKQPVDGDVRLRDILADALN